MNWIKVEDRLPELNEQVYWYDDDNNRVPAKGRFVAHVLAYDPNIGIFKAKFEGGKMWSEVASSLINGCVKPTHWQPLPADPNYQTTSIDKK